jgi:hypothetical protein
MKTRLALALALATLVPTLACAQDPRAPYDTYRAPADPSQVLRDAEERSPVSLEAAQILREAESSYLVTRTLEAVINGIAKGMIMSEVTGPEGASASAGASGPARIVAYDAGNELLLHPDGTVVHYPMAEVGTAVRQDAGASSGSSALPAQTVWYFPNGKMVMREADGRVLSFESPPL